MRPLRILLGDFKYFNKFALSNLFVPLNIGYIATYCKKKFGSNITINLYTDPEILLADAKNMRPDIVGLSLYYWNKQLNNVVARKIRSVYNENVIIVYGGPSVDIDEGEQIRMFVEHPAVDVMIPNEGETGFANIVERVLAKKRWNEEAIPGALFYDLDQTGSMRIIGKSIEKESFNLDGLDSPYLNGLLDPFLHGSYQPLIQTSRGCPYTCAYCASSKDKCKIRTYPIGQIKEEITFVAQAFKNRPSARLHLCNDNFGIFPQDIEIAAHFSKCSKEIGFPQKMEFYSEKKFSSRSKEILEILSGINFLGMPISLQSRNEQTLEAIGRKNLPENDIVEAIKWASSKGIKTSTELIFGLPCETLDSFSSLLDNCIEKGFDLIQCYNLILVEGSPLNRIQNRNKYNMKTMFRIPSSYYAVVDESFVSESEEIVVSTDSFSFEDYLSTRYINFMFHVVFSLEYYKWFFQLMKVLNLSVVDLFRKFMNPCKSEKWPKAYMLFLNDLKKAFVDELYSEKNDLFESMRKQYKENNNQVSSPSRINLYFAARLIYMENSWMNWVLNEHLKDVCQANIAENESLINSVLELSHKEWINFPEIIVPDPVELQYDFLEWRELKFKSPLKKITTCPKLLKFEIETKYAEIINGFIRKYSYLIDQGELNEYYYHSLDYIFPRNKLMFNLKTDLTN